MADRTIIDNEVRNTIGKLDTLINLPAQPVTDAGVDISLDPTTFTKQSSSPSSFHFSIINKGAENIYIKFDGTAAGIDTTDDTNATKTYNIVLFPKGSDEIDRVSIDGVAGAISLKTKAALASSVYMLIK